MNITQSILQENDDTLLYNLLAELLTLRKDVLNNARKRLAAFSTYYPGGQFDKSAYNLAHYLSLRQNDLRPLQDRLANLGLSSLGRSEAHVMWTLDSVIGLLSRIEHVTPEDKLYDKTNPDFREGQAILSANIRKMFGTEREFRKTYIMVTIPTEAATDSVLVDSMFEAGMDCARINCAHDNEEVWRGMITNIRRAEAKTGRRCRILMDLAGHKIRTGPVAKMPGIRHIKVKKDFLNNKQTPANVILIDEDNIQESLRNNDKSKHKLYIPGEVHRQLAPGDRLVFNDIRGKQRALYIMYRIRGDYWLTHCDKSAYLAADTTFRWERHDKNNKFVTLAECTFNGIGEVPVEIRLYKDDRLRLTRVTIPGNPAVYDDDGMCISHAHISCTTPEIIDDLKVGHPVWIDDGKLGTIVESKSDNEALLKVIYCSPDGMQLKEDKGINLPDTTLSLPALTAKDLRDLDVISECGDIVGYSFVESLADIDILLNELDKHNAHHLAVIAKIETKRAVKNLPEIILGTIGRRQLGIMIARGDLAIELGPERLSEIQEEILWLCEAAHIPVIWATQVLETMVKKGIISRPEFSDAAMGSRADCIMVNKGNYILHALHTLNDILVRMQAHQRKKQSLMRALHW